MEGGSRSHAKNENKIQTSGHRGSVENIEKLGFKIMKLGMVSCHGRPCRGKKNWPNRNKFWYKLLAKPEILSTSLVVPRGNVSPL